MNLKYKWVARFKIKTIKQPDDDKYSKHNPDAEWNPSSFRDFQDYFDAHPEDLETFSIVGQNCEYTVDFRGDKPTITATETSRWGSIKNTLLHHEKRSLRNVRVIYYRSMQITVKNGLVGSPEVLGYVIGYQGLDENGNNRKKTITVI